MEKIVLRRFESGGDLVRAGEIAVDDLNTRQRKGLKEFTSLIHDLEETLEKESLPRFVERVVERSGLGKYHLERDEVAGDQRLQNLEELMNAAALYADGRPGLLEFLEGIELDSARAAENEEGEANRVTLITMHNTKGLEFDRVFITGLEDGLFPRGGEESADELEEERRLFYVAVTRARDELFLTSCATRLIHGRTVELFPSRFLEEIPSELVEVDDGGSAGPFGSDSEGSGWYESGDEYPDATYPVGTYVYHDDYGTGVVTRCARVGRDVSVSVRFESGRVAKFLPKYTPLERISVDE